MGDWGSRELLSRLPQERCRLKNQIPLQGSVRSWGPAEHCGQFNRELLRPRDPGVLGHMASGHRCPRMRWPGRPGPPAVRFLLQGDGLFQPGHGWHHTWAGEPPVLTLPGAACHALLGGLLCAEFSSPWLSLVPARLSLAHAVGRHLAQSLSHPCPHW